MHDSDLMYSKASPVGIDPRNADAAIHFGMRAQENCSEREALPVLKSATTANPGDARLWQVLGLLHRALDELEPAVHAFRKAATLAPQDALIAHGHARVAMEAGLPAAHLFDVAHSLAPADGAILVGRSAAQLAEGKLANAMSDLDAVLLRNPAWQEGHSALSRLRWMAGEHGRFTESINRALVQTPNSPLLWSQLVLTFVQARQHSKVLQAIRDARQALGQSEAFLFLEACSCAELERTGEADALFALIGDEDNAMLIEHRIRHLLRSGRISDAGQFADLHVDGPFHNMILPYASIAWRLLGDNRWDRMVSDPNLIGVYDIADRLPPLDRLAETLHTLHLTQHEPLEQSLRRGTQTDGPLLSNIDPAIQWLRRGILAAVEEHVAKSSDAASLFGVQRDRSGFRFAGSWSVLLRGAGHHANHVHQAGYLSSALYVALPSQEEMGPAPAGWLTLGQPPAELKIDLPPFQIVEPMPGRLVLFPSTMWHGTNPIQSGERLSVAFDLKCFG